MKNRREDPAETRGTAEEAPVCACTEPCQCNYGRGDEPLNLDEAMALREARGEA